MGPAGPEMENGLKIDWKGIEWILKLRRIALLTVVRLRRAENGGMFEFDILDFLLNLVDVILNLLDLDIITVITVSSGGVTVYPTRRSDESREW